MRRSFRWCRIAALAGVLMLLLALTWLRLAGLPNFLRVRIVDELGRRGVTADFSSLRFHWFRGLVASELRVAWGGTNGPRLTIAEADLDLAPPPWHGSRELIRGLRIRSGSLVLPLPADDEPRSELPIDQVAADIRFLPGDAWEVRQLGATVLGLDLNLRASITNLAALRTTPTRTDPAAAGHRRHLLRSLVDETRRWQFASTPRLEVFLRLDGQHPEAASGTAYLEVPEVRTPHGDLRGLRISLRDTTSELPATNARLSRFTVELGGIQTGQGGADGISGQIELHGPARPDFPTTASWRFTVEHLFLRGLRARSLSLLGTNQLLTAVAGVTRAELESLPVKTRATLQARELETARVQGSPLVGRDWQTTVDADHPLLPRLSTNGTPSSAPPPLALRLETRLASLSGTPGTAGPVRLQAEIRRPHGTSPSPTPPPDNVSAWAHAWPWIASLDLAVSNLASPKLSFSRLELGLDWQAPRVTVRRLESSLYQGDLSVHGHLDVPSRETRWDVTTAFDLHGIDALLGPKSRENFARYQWENPPRFQGQARLTLPPWGAPQPDWNGVVKDSLRLDGRFQTGRGGFKGVPFDSAESSISFDGTYWRLPDLHTTRAEGDQQIQVEYNDDTREYRVDARGTVRPPILRPLIGEKSAEVLDLFRFEQPVTAVVSVWGPWTEGDKQSILGSVQATNLSFRGQSFDRLEASVLYTNRTLIGSPVRIDRGQGRLTVDGVGYEFESDRLTLTNALSTVEPRVVAAAISPEFAEKLQHYRFDSPPRVHANGTIHPRQPGTADLTFDIEGGPFHFWRFSANRIDTHLHWDRQNLRFTNIHAAFYRGTLEGHATFDVSDPEDGTYRFSARVRDARLEDLLHEVTNHSTNVAQGTFDLDLDIRSARTSDLRTWNGSGSANLRDGLLWDTPLFGFMSPVLNAIIPGIGNNRAKRADASFVVSNGVFHTRDMVIACPPATLLYRGTIDLDQRIDAKVEAQVLGEVAGFGALFGLVLKPLTKLFEYRVEGTLTQFDAQPLYALPKVILFPLQPLRFFRGMFTPGPAKSVLSTNSP